jgi:hypothetical protein
MTNPDTSPLHIRNGLGCFLTREGKESALLHCYVLNETTQTSKMASTTRDMF